MVCEDVLRECGRFLVVEHRRDIEVQERIPLVEIAMEGCFFNAFSYYLYSELEWGTKTKVA